MTDTRQPHDRPVQPYAGGSWPPYAGSYQSQVGYPGDGHHYGPSNPYSGPFAPAPAPTPKNGLATAALILGIVTVGLSPLPILNQAGILVGVVGVGLGIAGVIVGLRRRVRVVMSSIGLGLSILGIVAACAFTQSFVNSIGSTASSSPSTPARSVGESEPSAETSNTSSAAAPTYTLTITGSAKKSSMMWSVDGSSGSADQSTKVPWKKVVTGGGQSFHSVSLSAYTYPGTPGDLTCTITDQTGHVVDTKTAQSDGGSYGSASVNCMGSTF